MIDTYPIDYRLLLGINFQLYYKYISNSIIYVNMIAIS